MSGFKSLSLQAMIPLSIHQILLMTSASVDLLDPNWTTTLTFSNTSSRGSFDVRKIWVNFPYREINILISGPQNLELL